MTKVETIPMGVEPGIFSPEHRDPALRARLLARCELPETATLLLGSGRFSPEKRWPLVIASAMAAGYSRPLGLCIIGDGHARDLGGARRRREPACAAAETDRRPP